MNAWLYFPIFLYSMCIVAFIYGNQYMMSGDYRLQEKGNQGMSVPLLICMVLVFWLGYRPISAAFGDTLSYYRIYSILDFESVDIDWRTEWVWNWIMLTCHKAGLTANDFFTIIESGYILSILFAVRILLPNNVLLGMLFVFTSFSFFTFGVNGMRNGLATHLSLLGFALFLKGDKLISSILFLLAFGIHRSVALPIAAFFASIYFIKDTKNAIYIWIASILVSLVSGNFFSNLFAGLGFDDRMEQYLTLDESMALQDSTTSFRWDFLLYSSMPVLFTWIVCVKEEITDNWFNVLAKTYCLSNAFWVLVIRASFTNRFAYLSWFLYPIVIAYPLIMLPIWGDQDNKTGMILYAYVFLTLGICYFTGML